MTSYGQSPRFPSLLLLFLLTLLALGYCSSQGASVSAAALRPHHQDPEQELTLRAPGPSSRSLSQHQQPVWSPSSFKDEHLGSNSHAVEKQPTALSGIEAALLVGSKVNTDPLSLIDQSLGHTSNMSSADDQTPKSGSDNQNPTALDASAPPAKAASAIPDVPPLLNFEVNVPPRFLPSKDTESTTIELIYRSFANSYYDPSIIEYSPNLLPEGFRDPEKWVSIVLSQEGKSRGRQFDRLGSVQLGNAQSGLGVEVWRTDNAEPVNTTGGVVWITGKDVSKYYDLFRRDGQLLWDYPNIVNDVYTGALTISLKMTVHQLTDTAAAEMDSSSSSDVKSKQGQTPLALRTPTIYAISKHNTTRDSKWIYPEDDSTISLTLPQNLQSALVEVYASGSANDEFWALNSVNDDVYVQIPNATSSGLQAHGPYREIQVKIDGVLAGIAAPFEVFFTGGVDPGLWRPETGWGSYDQPTYLFDVTPFLGVVGDGKPHKYSLSVVSAEENEEIPLGWWLSGNLQVTLGPPDAAAEGTVPRIELSSRDSFVLSGQVTGNFSDKTGVLHNSVVTGGRTLTVTSTVTPAGSSEAMSVSTSSKTVFANTNTIVNADSSQVVVQTCSSSYTSRHGDETFLSSTSDFPLTLRTRQNDTMSLTSLDHSYNIKQEFGAMTAAQRFGEPESKTIKMRQAAHTTREVIKGSLTANVVGRTGSDYGYADSDGYTFDRSTAVYNKTVTEDEVGGSLKSQALPVVYVGGGGGGGRSGSGQEK